jgi:putative transcriptional regulator
MREKLVQLRGEKSQENVAMTLGISQKTLSAIERGFRNPSIELMKKIQQYYGISMLELFPDIFLPLGTTKRS